MTAAVAALDRIAAARARFEEAEARYRRRGDTTKADGAHQYVLWLIRAQIAERDDRRPAGLAEGRNHAGERG